MKNKPITKLVYDTPTAECVLVQMEQCIASPKNTIPDMGGNGVYDEDF